MEYFCPCCGYKTLDQQPPGTFTICPICKWEDDNAQFNDPLYEDGANTVSLKQAQKNFELFGAIEDKFKETVRKPNPQEERNPNWKIF